MALSVDYAQIIELANKRKDQLQDVQARLTLLPEQAKVAVDLFTYIAGLNYALSRLDNEAINILGRDRAHALIRSIGTMHSNMKALVENYGTERFCLSSLVHMLGIEQPASEN